MNMSKRKELNMDNYLEQLKKISNNYDYEDLKNKYKLLVEQLGCTIEEAVWTENDEIFQIESKVTIDKLKKYTPKGIDELSLVKGSDNSKQM